MWLAPDTGYANAFLEQLQRLSTDSTVVMLAIFAVFALVHSGLAYLRPYGAHLAFHNPTIPHQPYAMHSPVLDPRGTPQVPHLVGEILRACNAWLRAASASLALWLSMHALQALVFFFFGFFLLGQPWDPTPIRTLLRSWPGEDLMGARAYRVLFAAVSLPLAVVAVVYFINHRYDGMPLWNLRGLPGVHSAVFAANFVSFFFLYPSTFNLLEARPRLKLGSVL